MTNNIPKAIPTDPTLHNGYFGNDNLSFCSVASLRGFEILEVKLHPVKIGQKIFYFENSNEIRELWRQYSNNELRTDPKQLSFEISRVKQLPFTDRKDAENFYTSNRSNPEGGGLSK